LCRARLEAQTLDRPAQLASKSVRSSGRLQHRLGHWAAIDPQWLFRVAAVLIWQGTWPFAAGIICVTNDLMWWPPFVLYVHDAWPPKFPAEFQ
jgi:hypothetical protein